MASVFLTTGESSVTIKIRIWGNGWMVASLPGSNYLKLCFTNWEEKKTTVWARGNFFGTIRGKPETFQFFCFWTFVSLRSVLFIFLTFYDMLMMYTQKKNNICIMNLHSFLFSLSFILCSLKINKNWNNKKKNRIWFGQVIFAHFFLKCG